MPLPFPAAGKTPDPLMGTAYAGKTREITKGWAFYTAPALYFSDYGMVLRTLRFGYGIREKLRKYGR